MSEQNRSVVLRWFEEVWNQRRAETVDELMTAESICYGDLGPMQGASDFRKLFYEPLTQALPDLRVTVDGIVDDEQQVVVRWTAKGTHTGAGLPVPPTQRALEFSGISWICVRNGKLYEGWQQSNLAEVLRSCGATDELRLGGAPIPAG
ncbi:ester cyclase [Candidatus Laterigemmans baculatus]|uniref:ester cyclase n=1 Tax=Candidatus Laterigemmans baculatus TaxID=2770505 RepID=UPI0013DA19AF|nr:ester cyclase [Candidatus Laterigemmans baculatus]